MSVVMLDSSRRRRGPHRNLINAWPQESSGKPLNAVSRELASRRWCWAARVSSGPTDDPCFRRGFQSVLSPERETRDGQKSSSRGMECRRIKGRSVRPYERVDFMIERDLSEELWIPRAAV